ncbi:serine/threonine protein kinase [Plantactinospora solaniradicis]|uniref:non-specific serine/threonine protein kinase n=1 Tax=Plantactinospora solaniradicis TaxID=1723736 RepID=A0ABW1KK84_9ACTN
MTTDPEHGELVPLGDGPVATVLAGVDATTGEAFALKVFPGRLDRRTRAKLDRELAQLSAVRAHAPVLVADRVEERPDGRCALRMELCTQSLPELVDSFGPLSVPDTLVLGTVLAAALAATHAAGLVHGGVTPGNVLFRPSGEPVLSDAGLTLRHAFPRDPLSAVDFLPPEAVREGSADERSDLYGLGAVLYLALSGGPPHRGRRGEEPGARLLRLLGTPVPPLDRAGVPPELVGLVSALLTKDPAARPVSAAGVAEQLDALRVRVARPDESSPVNQEPTAADHEAAPPDQRPTPDGHQAPPPGQQPTPAEQRGFDDFATPGSAGAAPSAPRAEPPSPEERAPSPTEAPSPVVERQPPVAVPPTTPGPEAPPPAEPASTAADPSTAAPRPHGKPILVFGARGARRRAVAVRSVLAAVSGLTLLTAASTLLLLNRPGELTVPPAPAQVGAASGATAPARAVRLELADPADRGNFVELSWHSTEPLDFAVIVAAEGERAGVILAQRNNTYRVPVDPVRRYCFLIQGSDGTQVYESQPKPIRGATCVK